MPVTVPHVPEGALSDSEATLRQVEGVLYEFGSDGSSEVVDTGSAQVRVTPGPRSMNGFVRAISGLTEMRVRLRHGRALLLMEAEARGAGGHVPARHDHLRQAAAVLLDVEKTIVRLGELLDTWTPSWTEATNAVAESTSSRGA